MKSIISTCKLVHSNEATQYLIFLKYIVLKKSILFCLFAPYGLRWLGPLRTLLNFESLEQFFSFRGDIGEGRIILTSDSVFNNTTKQLVPKHTLKNNYQRDASFPLHGFNLYRPQHGVCKSLNSL